MPLRESRKQAKTKSILKEIGKKTKQHLVVAELLEHLMAVWGGPAAFAAAFHTTFNEANAGNMVRARMLGDVMNLFKVHSAALKSSGNTVENMTDEEMRAAMEDLLGSVDPTSDSEERELL